MMVVLEKQRDLCYDVSVAAAVCEDYGSDLKGRRAHAGVHCPRNNMEGMLMAARQEKLQPVKGSAAKTHKKKASEKAPARKKGFLSSILVTERDYFDYNLLAIVILLTCFGLVMLYSTSAYEASLGEDGNDMMYFGKQAVISTGALILALIGSQIDYHFMARVSPYLYFGSTMLLIATKFIGRTINGARRWIYIGSSISFQPAELAKVAVILFLPALIVKMGHKLKGIKAPLVILLFGAVSSFCTYYFTENLSTALIIAGISVILIFIVHPRTVPFVILGVIGVIVLAGLVYYFVSMDGSSSFRIRRIQVWLNPEENSSLGGYQVMQALYAVGSGGFLGKGLGNSAQKLGALPEAQNDMIFSIICEELGVFGAALLMLLFVFLLYRLFFIAQNAPDLLGSLIVSGIFIHIALQVVLNIAVVINLIPTTGITLPFISYGGTSILFLMSEIAIALSVSRQITFVD